MGPGMGRLGQGQNKRPFAYDDSVGFAHGKDADFSDDRGSAATGREAELEYGNKYMDHQHHRKLGDTAPGKKGGMETGSVQFPRELQLWKLWQSFF